MRSQLSSLGIAGLVAACLFSFSAQANSRGISGRSGKQGLSCMAAGCHATSASPNAPTVDIVGPATLAAGATGTYTLVIKGGPASKAGMNVAVDKGSLTPGAGQKALSGELTHSDPLSFTSGEARFDFSLVAPPTAGTLTVFASGNSTNGDGNNTGDNAVQKTLSVQITGGTGGTDGGTDGGTGTPDAGTDPGDGDGDEEEEDKGGCAAAGSAPVVLLLSMVAAGLLRRRE